MFARRRAVGGVSVEVEPIEHAQSALQLADLVSPARPSGARSELEHPARVGAIGTGVAPFDVFAQVSREGSKYAFDAFQRSFDRMPDVGAPFLGSIGELRSSTVHPVLVQLVDLIASMLDLELDPLDPSEIVVCPVLLEVRLEPIGC
jgi:hypothetical protein